MSKKQTTSKEINKRVIIGNKRDDWKEGEELSRFDERGYGIRAGNAQSMIGTGSKSVGFKKGDLIGGLKHGVNIATRAGKGVTLRNGAKVVKLSDLTARKATVAFFNKEGQEMKECEATVYVSAKGDQYVATVKGRKALFGASGNRDLVRKRMKTWAHVKGFID